MICQGIGMAISSLSGVLSPSQIAIVQQARALVARPQGPEVAAELSQARPPAPRVAQYAAPPGRGSIIDIVV